MAQRADDNDTDVDPEDDEDDPAGTTDVDDDEDDDEEDDGGSARKKSDPERARLSREAAKYRTRARTYRQERDALQAEVQRLKDEGVTGDEAKELKTERDTLKTENQNLLEQVKSLKVGSAIRDEMAALSLNPKKAKAILKVIDLDDIDVEEDGEVSGVREALEDVAQEYPEWVISQEDDDDKGGQDTSDRRSSRKPGRKKPGVDRNKLLSQYPALGASYTG